MPCETCACLDSGVECLADLDPARFGFFCAWCALGDPVRRRHVLNRSRIGILPAVMLSPAFTATQPESSSVFPLAGDLVADLAARVGADRAAKWVAAKLGTDCHCGARQAVLNRLHAKLRTYLARRRR